MKPALLPWLAASLLASSAPVLAAPQANAEGAELYARHCADCHQPNGEGMSGVFPPHRGHVGALYAARGTPDGRHYLGQVVLNGLTGPITVKDETYDGNMPAWEGALTPGEIAAVLNFMLLELDPTGLPDDFRPYTAEDIADLSREDLDGQDVRRLRQGLDRFGEQATPTVAKAETPAEDTTPLPLESLFPQAIQVAVQNSGLVTVLPSGEAWSGVEGAHYDALSPDGSQLLVSGFKTGNVYLLDARSGEVEATLPVGGVAQGVKISPDGRLGLAAVPDGNRVAVIDMEEGELIDQIPVGPEPHNSVFSADGDLAYVTLQGGGAIAVVDMRQLAKRDEIATPGLETPHNLDISADGRRLWIRDFVGRVGVLDLETEEMLKTLEVGNGHGGIDVIPGGAYVATGAIADATVSVIDARDLRLAAEVEVGSGPHGVRASRDGRYLYASITAEDTVAVIDTRTLKVVARVPAGGAFPFWIAVPGNP
ncbi:c-type cytochrome [Halomonas organivorans]